MNPMNKLRLTGAGVVWLLPLVLMACTIPCDECGPYCEEYCSGAGGLDPLCFFACYFYCELSCIPLEASQFCEEYPEECQQLFDPWVESLETVAEE
jgi:hypothetical protein